MKQLLLCLSILLLIWGCNDTKKHSDPELHYLFNLLSGSFTSEEQAKKEVGYANAHLVNTPIWKNKPGYWLYSETYNSVDTSVVYIQRILNIERLDSITFKSSAYVIPNSRKYRGGWKTPEIFNLLTPDSLELRNGCDLFYKKKISTIYVGKTNNISCISRINNVAYTTSNIVLRKDQISVWDKGYDVDGKQIWGKIKGPYKYKRISPSIID